MSGNTEHQDVDDEIRAWRDEIDGDGYTVEDWFAMIEGDAQNWIKNYASMPDAMATGRSMLVAIAALAVAGIQAIDRQAGEE